MKMSGMGNMSKKILPEQKACRIIEILVSEGICEELEFKVGVHNDFNLSKKEVEMVNRLFCTIYRLVHVANKPSCLASHDSWVKELNTKYKYFRHKGYFRRVKTKEVKHD